MYTYYESKKEKKVYVTLLLLIYSTFDMISCKKPEIQNGLLKITQIK